MRRLLVLLLPVALLLAAGLAGADTWNVPSPETPTIAAALDSVNDDVGEGDTVFIAPGTYYGGGYEILDHYVLIQGTGDDPGDVVVDAQYNEQILYIYETTGIVIRNITFRHGFADPFMQESGGALLLETHAEALIENCVFEEDSAGSGGAVSCLWNCEGTFRNCTFRANWAGSGAALFASGATVVLDSCLFELNHATPWGMGGAVYCEPCSLYATGTRFQNNEAGNNGGGIWLNISFADLLGCRFEENVAGYLGGALFSNASVVLADDPFLTQNTAQVGGGAYLYNGSGGSVHNGNFTHNQATGSGGGGAIVLDGSTTTISTTNFWYNSTAYDGGAMVLRGPAMPDLLDSCSFRWNEAGGVGGALIANGNGGDPSPTIDHCLFAGNVSTGSAAIEIENYVNLSLVSCTIAENDPQNTRTASLGCFNNSYMGLDKCLVAFAVTGIPMVCGDSSGVYVSCTDAYGNANGDWDGPLAPFDSINGNFEADPMFCGSDASPGHPYMLQGASPCVTDTCGLIGAEAVGCGFVKDWIGQGDGVNWEDPANWNPTGVPGPYDDVRLALASTFAVELSSAATVYRIVVGGPGSGPTFTIRSGSLEVTHEGTNQGLVVIQEGTFLGLGAGASFVNTAQLRLEGGDLLGEGMFVNGGDVRKVGPDLTSRIGVPFENRVTDPGSGWLYVEEGFLEVTAPLINSNTIRLYPSAVMMLDPGDGPLRTDVITNHGLVVVESGASIVLQAATTVFMNMGTGVVELQGGDITGAGRFVNHGLVRKTDPALGTRAFSHVAALFENAVGDPGDGAVRAEEGVLAIEEEFDNAGSLYVHTGAQVALDPGEGPLRADLLTNAGVVVIRSGSALSIDPAGTVFWNTQSGEVRLQGTAQILGAGLFRNHGLFVKEDIGAARALGHVAVFFENVGEDPGDGSLEVNEGDLWVEGELTNTGSIAVNAGASLLLDPGEGPLGKVRSTESGERTDGVLTNGIGGACEIRGSLAVAGGASLMNYGLVTIDVGASLVNDGVFDLRENGVLAGRGTFDNVGGSFTGGGVIRPGGSTGIFTFLGNFSQTATGEIEVEIGGTTPGTGYDRLAISGTAALDGALYTTLVGGFTPVEGDSFAVITIGGGFAGRTDFDCFSGLDIPGSLLLEPVQVPSAFSLVARDSTTSNGPPVATDDADSTDAASPILIHPLANDTDPEMQDLRVALVSTVGTTGLVVVLPGDSLIGYVPVRSFSGRDSFTYTVTDCGGGSDVATVTIGVARAPRAWVVPADQPTIAAGLAASWAKDTVVVASGTYHEHDLVMKSGVLLRSETMDPASVVIDADSLGRGLDCSGLAGTTRVVGITFMGGNAANGGGARVVDSDITIDRCVFRGNASSGLYGGGILLDADHPVIRRCVFENNRASYGGAIDINGSGSEALIESTVVVRNYASTSGAAVYAHMGTQPTLRSCTIAGNTCPTGTGGILVFGTVSTVVTLENSILAANMSGSSSNVAVCQFYGEIHASCTDVYGNSGGNFVGCLAGQGGVNHNFSADPRFCQFGNADDPWALMSGSPCAPENNPSCGLVGARPVGCGAVTGVEDAAPPAPSYRLFANRPNPFNPTTTIRFALPRAERAVLVVYDVSGRRVATIANGLFGPGEFDASWDGTDESGRDVASGIYFARLTAGDFAAVRKTVLLR